ncbi:hypothetical protein ACTFIV_008059 [Dictyostelium citrinum]
MEAGLEIYFQQLSVQGYVEPRYQNIFQEATANPGVSIQVLDHFSKMCIRALSDYGSITPGPKGVNYNKIREFLLDSHRLTIIFKDYNGRVIKLNQFENMIRFISEPVRYLGPYSTSGPGGQGSSTQNLNNVINMVREKYSLVLGVIQLQRSTTNFNTLVYRQVEVPQYDPHVEEEFLEGN